MGVPKFFRYISERYPCLSEFVKEYQIPIFDNLYLDMNGIIHMCSHPDDNNPHFRITEEKIFQDIFHYIEVLFRMIKPQKVFFMAVDGVAPRAKMNQQRGRRFRSAKEAEKSEKEALKKGEKLPEAERFDSNCITPGTEFMARLHEQLKYFVVMKISTDPMWKQCKVILSGQETPGEGEHKIMDYIRYIRSRPGYDPNTRHCLYGLDADLIMLGLCTHDPHFSLLREEVRFGKKAKRSNVPEEIRFYLLHLSLMREYLELEFGPLKESLKNREQAFDIEKIIDDWILMGFLVGNDFIPNLPNLHITNGALPILYKAYMEVLPTLDGYINEAGTLNLERFEKFMKKLSEVDLKNFEEVQDDLTYFREKTGRDATFHTPVQSKIIKPEEQCRQTQDPALTALIQSLNDLDISSEEESDKVSSGDEAFKNYKDEYYRNKMEFRKVTAEVLREQAEGYVRAIQWNLNYYYNGVCSWSWFYPHHYSPYISDIKGFANLKIEFDLGQPFKPYEQLLAVLPTASKNLLPTSYHSLMTDENSVIKDYYPVEFQTDLNGKRQEWEAVVLVPFIDENVLLQAMKPCNDLLTPEEICRNQHGPMLLYEFTAQELGEYEAPSYFEKVKSHANCTPMSIEEIRVPPCKLVKGAYPGVVFDVYYPGFPTLKHLKYTCRFENAKVKVFEMPSRNENAILEICPNDLYFEDSVPLDLLGTTIWVGWPHLVESRVVAILNREYKYIYCENDVTKYKKQQQRTFDSELEGVRQMYMERMGINFGETRILVHVQQMVGRKYVFTSGKRVNLEKSFSNLTTTYPLQTIVPNINVFEESYSTYTSISDVFPVGSLCFSLAQPYYGSQGTILESSETSKSNQLSVSLKIVKEPDLASAASVGDRMRNKYITLINAASPLAISNYVFSRVTGSLFILTGDAEGRSVNIGLNLKFNKKNQETPGYTRKIDNVWHYTDKAVDLVRMYIDNFPEIFYYLAHSNEDDIAGDQVFNEKSDEKVRSIQTWLKTLPTYNIERRISGSKVMEPEVVKEIEKIVDNTNDSPVNLTMQIKPELLFKPQIQTGNLAPDPLTVTQVFDRIVNVREGYTVPFGFKGTVIAIHKSSNALDNDDNMYDIVFDQPFSGGMALNCSEHRGYRLPKVAFINLSYGKRRLELKTGVPGALRALAKEQHMQPDFIASTSDSPNSAFASFNKSAPTFATKLSNKPYKDNLPPPTKAQPQQIENQESEKLKNSFHYLTDFSQPHAAVMNNGRLHNQRANAPIKKHTSRDQTANASLPKEPTIEYQLATRDQTTKNDRRITRDQCVNVSNNVSTPRGQPSNVGSNSRPITRNQSANGSNNRSIVKDPPTVQQQNQSRPKLEVNTDFLKRILNIQNDANNAVKSRAPVLQRNELIQLSSTSNRQHPKNRTNVSACTRLLNYYQSNSLGCPRYTYFENSDGICAQVALPNGKSISGKTAPTREEASENVASDSLNILVNNSESGQQELPSQFPTPPPKWVREKEVSPRQMSNNASSTQPQYNFTDQRSREIKPSVSSRNNYVSGQDNSRNTNSNSYNFVPLQAVKKRAANKPSGSANSAMHSKHSTKKENADIRNFVNPSNDVSGDKVQERNTGKKNERREKRKPRIAANFKN